jgi:hypothetical protein
MIIPKPYDLIRHVKAMDVCVRIHKTYNIGHKYKIKGMWMNMGFVNTFPMGMIARFEIKNENLGDWEYCTEPDKTCVRYSTWRNLKP